MPVEDELYKYIGPCFTLAAAMTWITTFSDVTAAQIGPDDWEEAGNYINGHVMNNVGNDAIPLDYQGMVLWVRKYSESPGDGVFILAPHKAIAGPRETRDVYDDLQPGTLEINFRAWLVENANVAGHFAHNLQLNEGYATVAVGPPPDIGAFFDSVPFLVQHNRVIDS